MPVSSPVPGKRLPLVRVDMNNGVPGYHLATTTNRNERVGNIRTRPPIRTMTAYLEEDAAEVVLVHGHQRTPLRWSSCTGISGCTVTLPATPPHARRWATTAASSSSARVSRGPPWCSVARNCRYPVHVQRRSYQRKLRRRRARRRNPKRSQMFAIMCKTGSEPECRRRQQQPRCPGTKRWRVCRQWCINRLASSVTEPLRHGRRFPFAGWGPSQGSRASDVTAVYKQSTKGWMTGKLFDEYCAAMNMKFGQRRRATGHNAVLTLDNASSHT
eukprot:1175833-Prorocentrum_minimum.AAC.1